MLRHNELLLWSCIFLITSILSSQQESLTLAKMNPNMRLLMEQVNIPLEDKTHRLAWKRAGNGTPNLQRFILIQS